MPSVDLRVRPANAAVAEPGRDFVLYWMQMFRRLDHNHALDYALRRAIEMGKPLVVYEGLKLGYPWASVRHHRFILEGMRANAEAARARGINYWPFVETPADSGRGLLRRLAGRAYLVVTDDYPAFIVPGQTAALAASAGVAVHAVDGNGVVPLAQLGPPVAAAAHLRPRIHRLFPDAWRQRAAAEPDFPKAVRVRVDPPFTPWQADDLDAFLATLPLDRGVPAVAGVTGGNVAGKQRLRDFVARSLARYADERNAPAAPEEGPSSALSPYLHYGHVSAQEVVEAVLDSTGAWDAARLGRVGRRDSFFTDEPNVNSYLDETITWRDLGYHWHWHRRDDAVSLERALPDWAKATLRKHAADPRAFVYSPEELEAGRTHDPLWNATQRQLVAAGRIHNYLRMLWGKKVLEWSATPEEAYRTLEHLNNKYALDGRDPNSYTGILWVFGLFDRPWPPERPVFGSVRYMSSDNTARKYRLQPYLEYVERLPTIAAVRSGQSGSEVNTTRTPVAPRTGTSHPSGVRSASP